jgi:hypothetical protein
MARKKTQSEPQEPEVSLDGLFDRLLEINRQAFAGRHYNTSYHTLCAALHLAHDAKNAEQLKTVHLLVKEALAWIDHHSPEYKHSTHSATLRGHASIFFNLQRQAEMMVTMLRREHQFDSTERMHQVLFSPIAELEP